MLVGLQSPMRAFLYKLVSVGGGKWSVNHSSSSEV